MSEIKSVCDAMLMYIQNSLETPHPLFSGLPICPFARTARLRDRLEFWVYSFQAGDEIDIQVSQKIEMFFALHHKDVLLVVHPDPTAMSFTAFNQLIETLNQQLYTLGLVAFGGHSDDLFEVNGVRTRHDPFINFTVQQMQKLSEARYSLIHNTDYYAAWTPEALDAVGVSLP
jgi:hypothetical protein